ncbi:hypothetical protein Fmac_001669 [Flemingia macrophylla]|uniref:Ribosomal protein L36 n=1 Tax=Flemingia macrophylla TaxID=520843 RepID=A0ABD1NHT0_9FABA
MLDNTFTKSEVVFLFTILNATFFSKVSRITPRTYQSNNSQSVCFMSSNFFFLC